MMQRRLDGPGRDAQLAGGVLRGHAEYPASDSDGTLLWGERHQGIKQCVVPGLDGHRVGLGGRRIGARVRKVGWHRSPIDGGAAGRAHIQTALAHANPKDPPIQTSGPGELLPALPNVKPRILEQLRLQIGTALVAPDDVEEAGTAASDTVGEEGGIAGPEPGGVGHGSTLSGLG